MDNSLSVDNLKPLRHVCRPWSGEYVGHSLFTYGLVGLPITSCLPFYPLLLLLLLVFQRFSLALWFKIVCSQLAVHFWANTMC